MKFWHFFWLLPGLAQAHPSIFSDGRCSLTFPAGYQSEGKRVSGKFRGARYSLTRTPAKGLDPAQQLAALRREQLARHVPVQLIKIAGRDALEVRQTHLLARMAVFEGTIYQVQVNYPEARPPAPALSFVSSLRFLSKGATPYTKQRMTRYDTQIKNIPVQKCAEQLLEISSLLTGFKLKNKRFPSQLESLHEKVTRGYGYRRQGTHYLLYCQGHHHPGLPEHYPRSDDALHTMLGPDKPYTPGY